MNNQRSNQPSRFVGLIISLILVLIVGQSALQAQQESTNWDDVQFANSPASVAGSGFFPIGMYHTSWAGTKAQKMAALEQTAAMGFNLIHPALENTDRDFLDRAHQLGVRVIIEANDDNGLESMVHEFKDHPAVLGWLVADDFNTTGPSVSTITQTSALVKSIAPHHITYQSGNIFGAAEYAGAAEAMGIQTYSIPTDPLEMTYDWLEYTQSVTNDLVIANLQSYQWSGYRKPTPAEIRNITYQSIIVGVDGILYYTYFDELWNLEQHPDLVNEFYNIGSEMQALMPMITGGNRLVLDTSDTKIKAGYWQFQNRSYMIVLNSSLNSTKSVNLEIPFGGTDLVSMFTGRPDGLSVANGYLTGNIGPTEVHIYEILNDSGPNPTPSPTEPTTTPNPTTPAPTQPSEPVHVVNFSILGQDGILVKNDAVINGGDVAANLISDGPYISGQREVTFNSGAQITNPNSRLFGDTVILRTDSQVQDAFVNDLSGSGSVNGTQTTVNLPIVTDFPDVPSFSAGTQDLTVEKGETLTLHHGDYGKLFAQDNSVVFLTGGVYNFDWWDIRNNVQIIFQGPTEIRIQGRLRVLNDTFIGAQPGISHMNATKIVFYVLAENGYPDNPNGGLFATQLGLRNTVEANIFTPNGTLRIHDDSVAQGAFIGRWVSVGKRAVVSYASAFGGPIDFSDAGIDPTEEPTTTPEPTTPAPTTTPTTPAPTEPPVAGNPDLKDFAVFAEDGLFMQESSLINSGHAGVNLISSGPYFQGTREITINPNARLGPNSDLYGNEAYIQDGVQVHDVYVNSINGPGSILGNVNSISFPLISQMPSVPSVNPGTENLLLVNHESRVLNAGQYGELYAQDNATVIFAGGVYHFSSWNIRNNVQILFRAPTEIRVAGTVLVLQNVSIAPESGSGLSASQFIMTVLGLNGNASRPNAYPYAVKFGYNNNIQANIYVPNGTLRIDQDSQATGAFLGRWVMIGLRSQVNVNSAFGGPINIDNPPTETPTPEPTTTPEPTVTTPAPTTPAPTPTTPAPTEPPVAGAVYLHEFSVLGEHGILLENDSAIQTGHVGANLISGGPFFQGNREITLNPGSSLSASAHLYGNIAYLKDSVQVHEVHINEISGPGIIHGTVHHVSLPLVQMPTIPSVNPGPENLTLAQYESRVIDAGQYGQLSANHNATVIFSGGVYHFSSWNIRNNVQILFRAPTEIRIAGTMLILKNATVAPEAGSGLSASQLVVIVMGVNGDPNRPNAYPYAAKFGANSNVQANIYAPNGTLRIDRDSQFTGAFLGKWVMVGKRSTVNLLSAFYGAIDFSSFAVAQAPAENNTPEPTPAPTEIASIPANLSVVVDAMDTAYDWQVNAGSLGNVVLNDAGTNSSSFSGIDAGEYILSISNIINNSDWALQGASCSPTTGTFQAESASLSVSLAEGADVTCIFQVAPMPKVVAGIYHDQNQDGQYTLNTEPVLANWQLTAYDANFTQIAQANSDGSGQFNLTLINAGAVTICQTPVDGWTNSRPGPNTSVADQICQTVTVNHGDTATIWFGNHETVVALVDSDGDGFTDDVDSCPTQGDAGHGVDANGCPNPPPPVDSDGDGFTDNVDSCPTQGDAGHGVDANGCPNPPPIVDTDGDGYTDDVDACPTQGDTGHGVDANGCPNPPPPIDTDGDGFIDDVDSCPTQGDLGSGVDANGCPNGVIVIGDGDGDGIIDAQDACPTEGDQGHGVDATGCPLPPPSQ